MPDHRKLAPGILKVRSDSGKVDRLLFILTDSFPRPRYTAGPWSLEARSITGYTAYLCFVIPLDLELEPRPTINGADHPKKKSLPLGAHESAVHHHSNNQHRSMFPFSYLPIHNPRSWERPTVQGNRQEPLLVGVVC